MVIQIIYEATFEDGESEMFALEVTRKQLADHAALRQLCLDDLDSRWMPEYDNWPVGAVTDLQVELPNGSWIDL